MFICFRLGRAAFKIELCRRVMRGEDEGSGVARIWEVEGHGMFVGGGGYGGGKMVKR